MSYASAKGRTPSGSLKPLNAPPPRPLGEAEKEAVAERARQLKQHLPEAMDFLKELHAEGLVDGLRAIVSVTVFEEVNHGSD